MDDNLESSDLQTSGFVRKQFNNFIHKIERECPRSLISVVRDTGELNALDAFIEEVDPLNYDQQKAGIDRELEEIKKQYANAYVWNGNVKALFSTLNTTFLSKFFLIFLIIKPFPNRKKIFAPSAPIFQ